MKSSLIRLAFVCLFTGMFVLSHAQKKYTNALELNEYLVTIVDTLYAGGTEWGQELKSCIAKKDFTSLSKVRKRMENFIDVKQKELTSMKDNWGSENLRKAYLDFLEFEKALLVKAFLPFEKFGPTTSEDEISQAVKSLSGFSDEENEANLKIIRAQEVFAEKNGFPLSD